MAIYNNSRYGIAGKVFDLLSVIFLIGLIGSMWSIPITDAPSSHFDPSIVLLQIKVIGVFIFLTAFAFPWLLWRYGRGLNSLNRTLFNPAVLALVFVALIVTPLFLAIHEIHLGQLDH